MGGCRGAVGGGEVVQRANAHARAAELSDIKQSARLEAASLAEEMKETEETTTKKKKKKK